MKGLTKRRDSFEPGRPGRPEARAAGRASGRADRSAHGDFSGEGANARQVRVACARTSVMSGAAPQVRRQLHERGGARKPTRPRPPPRALALGPSKARRHFFGSFCFAARIFLSISPRSIESPSPLSTIPGGNRLVVALQRTARHRSDPGSPNSFQLIGGALRVVDGGSACRPYSRPSRGCRETTVVGLDFERLFR